MTGHGTARTDRRTLSGQSRTKNSRSSGQSQAGLGPIILTRICYQISSLLVKPILFTKSSQSELLPPTSYKSTLYVAKENLRKVLT
jgi:hypothetical protein